MQIHEMIKDAMEKHKAKITIIQWAIMNGLSSLVYSEYLKNIKQKQVPVNMVLVPEIKYVQELLDPDGELMKALSNDLIDRITKNDLFKKYSDAPELVLFKEENIEILKTIFDLYIIQNISRRVPETIAIKFGLNDPQQQLIRQSRELDLFNRKFISFEYFDYVVDETVLQLLIFLQTMKKNIDYPESNVNQYMIEGEILTVNHENAICPIHFNDNIIKNEPVMELLSFITNTTITKCEWKGQSLLKNDKVPIYEVNSNPFNKIAFTTLQGINYEIKEEAGA